MLSSPDAPSSWLFPRRLVGLTATLAEDGSVVLRDAKGSVAGRVPAGQMSDSLFDPESGEFTTSSAVRYELVQADRGQALRVSADEAWLHDPARVYPVSIDPSFDASTTEDVFVDNYNGSVHDGNNLPVGTAGGMTGWNPACNCYNAIERHRSFVRFSDSQLAPLANTQITFAKIQLYHTWSYDCPPTDLWMHTE
jgi:hypothetical protein